MDPRFILLDALISLAKGNVLYRGGDTAYGVHLAGVPFAVLILDDLFHHGWIRPLNGSDFRYALTDAGRDALRDGAAWYRSLPIWRRLISPRPALRAVCPAPLPGIA